VKSRVFAALVRLRELLPELDSNDSLSLAETA